MHQKALFLTKVTSNNKTGMMIALNCETDFVAKNADFVAFALSILDKALASGAKTLEEVLALTLDGKSTIAEKVIEQSGYHRRES
jgi:elongation factor Ts